MTDIKSKVLEELGFDELIDTWSGEEIKKAIDLTIKLCREEFENKLSLGKKDLMKESLDVFEPTIIKKIRKGMVSVPKKSVKKGWLSKS